MEEAPSQNCLNCNSELSGPFCHQCGQSAAVSQITFKDTIKGYFSSTFALEGRFPKSIFLLISNPGKLFREYLQGKRKTYYEPVAFFVVSTAVYILLRGLIGYDPLEGQMTQPNANMHPTQKILLESARFMVDNINNIMFTLVFSIGLVLKIFFRKAHNLAEYSSIGFYIAGAYILFGVVFMVTFHIIEVRENRLQLLVLFAYLVYCFWSFYRRQSFLSFVKYVFAAGLSILLYMVFGFGISALLVSLRGVG